MSEIIVTETSVLYRDIDKTIIAEVFVGEAYSIPDGVLVYVGTLEDFLKDNPEYDESEEIIKYSNEYEYFTNYEEI